MPHLAIEVLSFDQELELFQDGVFKKIVNENSGFYVKPEQALKHFQDSTNLTYLC